MKRQTIKKQKEFVKWLIDKGIYNLNLSAQTMNEMYKVWAVAFGK
jgi:hypothetical protein